MSHLTATQKDTLNRMNGIAYKEGLGNKISESLGCVVGTYDFSTQGGAIGTLSLKDSTGNVVKLPANALIVNAFTVVRTALTSGGSATIALNSEGAGDLLAATAVASFSSAAKLQGVPDFGTLADSVLTTAERTLQTTIATAALTAGKFNVFVFYVLLP